jgi:hypothetical protein
MYGAAQKERMFSLTIREQFLVAAILLSVVAGSIVQHVRHRLPAKATDAIASDAVPSE